MLLQDTLNQLFYSMTINELQLMNTKFQSLNITYNSLLYLDIISYTNNCTITFLAQSLYISKSAVTIKINEMVKQGLIIKEQSEDDKRVFYLKLNDNIATIYQKYDKALYKTIEAMDKTYSKQELETFCRIMSDIEKTYTKEIQNGK